MARDPKAQVEITAESRTLGAKLREARAKFGTFAGALRKEVFGKALFDGPKASAHLVGQLGAMGVSKGLGFFEEQAQGVFHFNQALINLQLAARRTPEEAQAIGNAARQIATETGLASETVLAGGKAWIDLAGAEKYSTETMRTLARTARASNTEIGAMVTTMYALQNSMKVRPEEMEDTLSGLINQSKDGHIHFAQMADELIGVAPKFARFGVTGREGTNELGAMFQIVRSGSKDAEETTTKLDGIFRGLIRNAAKFKAGGVTVFNVDKDGVKTLKPFQEIWAQLEKSRLMKDPSKLIKAFGRGDGEAGIRLLIEQREDYNKLIEAGRVNGTVMKDLATINESAGGRTAIAMERIKNAIADAFTPERINAFVSALEGVAEKVGPLAESMGKLFDGYNALYGAGQSIRGFLTPDESKLAAPTIDEINMEARAKGVSPAEAARSLQDQRGRYLAARNSITDAMVDGKTTPESTKRAVAALISTQDRSGEGARRAGAEYAAAAHLPPDQVAALKKQILAEKIDADIEAGQGRSVAQQQDMGAAFLKALNDAAPAIGRSVAQAISGAPPMQLKADGKTLVEVHRGSRAHASRPGG